MEAFDLPGCYAG